MIKFVAENKHAMVECLNYQIPVTQLKGANGRWRYSKRDSKAPPTSDFNNVWRGKLF